jgi:hypothetical protein
MLFVAAIVIAVVICMPLASIWALNILFPILVIPFTFDTWCAAVILGGVFGGGFGFVSKK